MTKTKIDWCDYRVGNSRIKSGKYILVYCPRHPHSKSKGHVYEHRYMMEKCLKRYLQSFEHVHHLDGNGTNNDIINLVLLNNKEHAKEHYRFNPKKNKNGTHALIIYAANRKLERKMIFCACGCGQMLTNRDSQGRVRRFIHGHNQVRQQWNWRKKT